MSFWNKDKPVTPSPALAKKEEVVREHRGKLAESLVDLDRARHRLEDLMNEMLSEVDKSHGRK